LYSKKNTRKKAEMHPNASEIAEKENLFIFLLKFLNKLLRIICKKTVYSGFKKL
jgi:hypothetical protein